MELILASASPRRSELLRQVGCRFSVMTSDAVEDNTRDMPPHLLAILHAKAKAVDVAAKTSAESVVIGADTIVVLKNRVYGKPADVDDARRMLIELSGQRHEVITGIAVSKDDQVSTDFAVTTVSMRNLSKEEIENYVASGEPMDKAGSYAIQGKGALLIDRIEGSYDNVVGLPLVKLYTMLRRAGVSLL